MRVFWPVAEASQADYEALRAAAISGVAACDPAARRFARAGLAGLIVAPMARPGFLAVMAVVPRPAWSPYADPRADALAAGYGLLLGAAEHREPIGQGGAGRARG